MEHTRFGNPAWINPLLLVGGGGLWLLTALISIGSPSTWVGMVGSIGVALLGTLLLHLIPGLAVLRWLWPDGLSRSERGALALLVGVALPPLLLHLTTFLGIPWTRWTTLVWIGLAAVIWLWPYPRSRVPWRSEARRELAWAGWVMVVLLGLGLLIRLYVVRDLPAPMWADSVHHTIISQLIVEQRGVPADWHPLVPLTTFTYHYGYHANVAFLHWLTGLPLHQCILLMGQIIGTWAIAGAYVLTRRLTGMPLAGVWAGLLTGFVSIYPMYYFNWGRYTQLTGQIVLVALILAWLALFERPTWRLMIVAASLTAAIAITHMIVAVWAVMMVILLILALLARQPTWRNAGRVLGISVLTGMLGIGLALPWMIRLIEGPMFNKASRTVEKFATNLAGEPGYMLPNLTMKYLHPVMLILVFVGVFLAFAKRNWRMALCGAWGLGLTLLVVPYLVNLPLSGIVTGFAYGIGIYVVALPLAAYAIVMMTAPETWHQWLPRFPVKIGLGLHLALIVAVTLWAGTWQPQMLDPKFQLLHPADRQAMDWIQAETPADAIFLVAMQPAYGGRQFIGGDGGWWIPYFTQRQTSMPPMTYASERGDDPEWVLKVNAFGNALLQSPLPSQAAIDLLKQNGIDYIYVGIRQDAVNIHHDYQAMRYMPAIFEIVYERDGIVIFKLR